MSKKEKSVKEIKEEIAACKSPTKSVALFEQLEIAKAKEKKVKLVDLRESSEEQAIKARKKVEDAKASEPVIEVAEEVVETEEPAEE